MLEMLAARVEEPGAMCELKLDDDRWRREDVGMGWWNWPSSGSLKPVEVDDAVDATDAVCCRRRVSSRVSRFTWYLVLC